MTSLNPHCQARKKLHILTSKISQRIQKKLMIVKQFRLVAIIVFHLLVLGVERGRKNSKVVRQYGAASAHKLLVDYYCDQI